MSQRRSDLSDYITHFTKAYNGKTEFQNHSSICYSQVIEAFNEYGVARNMPQAHILQNSVCFSEVPLHELNRIAERRSRYGIGFHRSYVKDKGALPVWYVENASLQHQAINELIRTSIQGDPIWALTPFIDITRDNYRFEWEREWRHIGRFSFATEDVAFLIIPEELHESASDFFHDVKDQNTGPSYECPFIDSSWTFEKVNDALY